MKMEIVSILFLISVLTITGYAAPLLDAKDTWNEIFESVIRAACPSDEQCWEWLPVTEIHGGGTSIIPHEDNISRLQSRRQINPITEPALKSWEDSTLQETRRDIRPPLLTNKRIPTKITKKDVFISRGAGGMPFSVLYMNPQSNHAVTTSMSQGGESSVITKSSLPAIERPKYQRSRSTIQPRKQYFGIPHFFILYGLGPFGK